MKKYILAIVCLVIVGTVVILLPTSPQFRNSTNSKTTEYNNDKKKEESLLPDDIGTIQEKKETVPLDTIPSSITVLVNKKYLLPSTYIPKDLVYPNVKFSFYYKSEKRQMRKEAATALENMFTAAKKDNIALYGVSGYRSYVRQNQIYKGNVRTRGTKDTDTVSARPGSSEHQTGLSIDISARSVSCRLDQDLGDTTEGRWIAKNAYKYGYIIRYPKGKEDITGYSYEPWHIRYVGKSVAKYLYQNKLCLEEYYGLDSSYLDGNTVVTGVDVEDPDTVKYSTPTPKPSRKPRRTATPSPSASATPRPTATTRPRHTATPKPTPKRTAAPKPTATSKHETTTPTHTDEPAEPDGDKE